jgi:ankyrin repeat protein
MKVLLRNGALLDVQDTLGRTPMEIAILFSYVDGEDSCGANLLKHGA